MQKTKLCKTNHKNLMYYMRKRRAPNINTSGKSNNHIVKSWKEITIFTGGVSSHRFIFRSLYHNNAGNSTLNTLSNKHCTNIS